MHNDQTISFYNAIAAHYNAMMEKDAANKIIRKMVSEKFIQIVKEGLVLDFGGGTGLDLEWLLQNNYKIIFCEPSANMKEIAIRDHQDSSVEFLEADKTDFYTWHHELPFHSKTDAVLCNFAVINCIPDLKSLFQNLALVMKPKGSLIGLILENNFRKMMKHSWRKALASAIFKSSFKFTVHSGSLYQTVHIHTNRMIKISSAKYFEFIHKENWNEYGFSLIHLIKK